MIVVQAPDYLPGCTFFALARHADTVVLADTYQYSRQSHQNRARLRSPQGWHWITIPLHGGQHGLPVLETRIDGRVDWAGQHRRSVQYNYSSAPFYDYYIDPLESIWREGGERLGTVTTRAARWLLAILAPEARVFCASELPGAPADLSGIVHALGGGEVLLSEGRRRHDGPLVETPRYARVDVPVYRQNFPGFEAGVSAIDLVFNLGPEAGRLLDTGFRWEEVPASGRR